MRRRDGFTLVEVLVATTILAIGLLSLALMQLHALKGGSTGRHTTTAAVVARDQLEQLQRASWTAIPATAGWVALPNVTTTVANGAVTSTEETYRLEYRVTNVTTSWTRALDVRVTWDEQDRQNKRLVLSSYRYNW